MVQWLRAGVYVALAALTFYNAARLRGLMKLWFLFLGAFFLGLVGTVYLHLTNSPAYDEYVNDVFSPIAIGLLIIAIAFVINHKVPPFNRRKEDL